MRPIRILERKGQLIAAWASGRAETPLADEGGGRVHTDPPSFAWETVRFDGIADGKTRRCTASGSVHVRVDTP